MDEDWPAVPDGYFRRFDAEVETLDPVAVTDDASEAVVTKLFDTLYTTESGTEPEPCLATEIERDGSTLVVDLREDVSFHDGKSLTASDVVYTFERIAASPASERQSYLLDDLGVTHETDDGAYVPGSLGVTARDRSTVLLERDGGTADPEQVLSHPTFSVVPDGRVDDVPGVDGAVSQETFAREPVGTGPFELETWESPVDGGTGHVAVSRFDSYHGDGPLIEGVSWVTNADGDERYRHIQAGTVDATGTPDSNFDESLVTVDRTDDLGREHGTYGPMENEETLGYVRVPTLGSFYVGFDTDAVPRPIRRAVADVLNQHVEATEAFGASYEPAYHLCGPASVSDADRLDSHTEAYPYGVDERRFDDARERVAQLGHDPEDPYELRFTTQYTQDWSLLSDQLTDDLASVGIDLVTDVVDAVEKRERHTAGELEMFLDGWIADWPTLHNKLRPLSPADGDWPEDTSVEAAWQELTTADSDSDDALEAALRVEELNWETVTLLPLYHYYSDNIWHDHVDFQVPGPLGLRRAKHTHVSLGDRRTE
ncbi:MAG: ABC transporter substrate-binding protein [Halobaculum sp.]